MSYAKLTDNRKRFVDQLIPLIDSTFNTQSDEDKQIKTISVNASWGMGKSLLKVALEEKLKEANITAISINAWETDYFNDPMKSLIGEINEKKLNTSTDFIQSAEGLIANSGKAFVKLLGTFALKQLKFSDDDIKDIKLLLTGVNTSGIDDYKKYKGLVQAFKNSFTIGTSIPKRVIIVDELDRCKPTYAIEMLEAIKHIFDVYNLTFVFLINKEQLKCTVQNLYGCNINDEDYFEKFFDIQLRLPEIDIEDFIKIEYANYKYELGNLMDDGKLNFEKFMTALLLKLLELNYSNLEKKSVRELRKSLNKFNSLVKTFTDSEKTSLLLVLGFVVYFIYREYYTKGESEFSTRQNIYGFKVRNILDKLLTKEKSGSYYNLPAIDKPHNEQSLIPIDAVAKFYSVITTTSTIYITSSMPIKKIEDIADMEISRIFDEFSERKYWTRLPFTQEFIDKYKNDCLKQWCKDKYEFTHFIEG